MIGECKTCTYWYTEGMDEPPAYGDCRRYAPRPVLTGQCGGSWDEGDFYATWPTTARYNGCGDWKQGWKNDPE